MKTNHFINDLLKLSQDGKIPREVFDIENGLIFFHFSQLFDVWAKENEARTGGRSWLMAAEKRAELSSLPGFVLIGHPRRLAGHPRRCVVFYRNMAPKAILTIVGLKK